MRLSTHKNKESFWILSSLAISTIFLAGCATTQPPSDVNNLQIKVTQLEHRVDERDERLSELEHQVSDISDRLSDSESGSSKQPIEEAGGASSSSASDMPKSPISDKAADQIIRVPVTPQKIQEGLKKAGYYDGIVDGKIGSKTKQSIMNFQKDHNLTVDGIVGKGTWNQLKFYIEGK